MLARRPPALSPASDTRPHLVFEGLTLRRDLVPATATRYVIGADISAREKLERGLDLVAKIELRAPLLSEGLEPRREDEIGDEDRIDLVSEIVRLAGVAYFVRVQDARLVRVLDERRQIDVGITQHF